MKQNIIAIICDCDDTLTPDTTNFWLQHNGINTKRFWDENYKMTLSGWDPPIAWMTQILELIGDGRIAEDSNKKLRMLGRQIKPFKGVAELIPQLKRMVKKNDAFSKHGISLEFYIISSGFEDLIKGTSFGMLFDDVFGGTYYELGRRISGIKSSVTFTEKTKFLYAINKGIKGRDLRSEPWLVNEPIEQGDRRIPFQNMLYLGDSPGDIPCFSAVKKQGGDSIGIMGKKTTMKGLKLARGNRTTVGPYLRNYSRGSDLRRMIETIISKSGYEIVARLKS